MFDPWVGKIPWRRERLPTPVFWHGDLYSPWGCKESNTTERLSHHYFLVSPVVKNLHFADGMGSVLVRGLRSHMPCMQPKSKKKFKKKKK